jgi:excisionase family DNA binding protein
MSLDDSKQAYTIAEFCSAYGVSHSKVYLLFAAGDLTPVKLGSKNLITAQEADRWLQTLPPSTTWTTAPEEIDTHV